MHNKNLKCEESLVIRPSRNVIIFSEGSEVMSSIGIPPWWSVMVVLVKGWREMAEALDGCDVERDFWWALWKERWALDVMRTGNQWGGGGLHCFLSEMTPDSSGQNSLKVGKQQYDWLMLMQYCTALCSAVPCCAPLCATVPHFKCQPCYWCNQFLLN